MSSSTVDAVILASMTVAAGLAFLLGGNTGFPLDDAWIHLSYARSLATGDGLAYNPGVPATGCTAPLWALMLAVPSAVVRDNPELLVRLVQVLGLGLHALSAILTCELVRPWGRRLALIAGATLALSPAMIAASCSGMEVPLATALILSALLASARSRMTTWGWATGLLWVVRPEAALAASVGVLGLRKDRGLYGLLGAASGPLFVGLALAAWNFHASGQPLPATFYMKANPAGWALLERVAAVLSDFLPQAAPFWGYGWLGAALLGARRAPLSFACGLVFLVGNTWFIKPVDPNAFYHLRYLLPAVAPLVVAGAAGFARLGPRAGPSLATALALLATLATWAQVRGRFHNDVRNINEVQVAMGVWLRDRLPPGAWIAASDAGAVRWFSEHPVVDVMGLNTPEFWWDPAWRASHPVTMAALMVPAWFRPVTDTVELARFRTEAYTVTGSPAMGSQAVFSCPASGMLRFEGLRSFELPCAGASTSGSLPAPRGYPSQ